MASAWPIPGVPSPDADFFLAAPTMAELRLSAEPDPSSSDPSSSDTSSSDSSSSDTGSMPGSCPGLVTDSEAEEDMAAVRGSARGFGWKLRATAWAHTVVFDAGGAACFPTLPVDALRRALEMLPPDQVARCARVARVWRLLALCVLGGC